MNPRLKSPFTAVVLAGALVAGSVAFAGPASAAPLNPAAGVASAPVHSADPDVTFVPSGAPLLAAPARKVVHRALADDVVDPAPLRGSYALSVSSVWIFQEVTLTELSVVDDNPDAGVITRTVDWGDGSDPVPLNSWDTSATKTYDTPGTYPVTVTLSDTAGHTGVGAVSGGPVAVTMPGAMTLSKTAVYLGEKLTVTVSGVQKGTSKVSIDLGDGRVYSRSPGVNGSADVVYYRIKDSDQLVSGTLQVRVTFYNANGDSTLSHKLTIKRDTSRPTITLSKPKKSKANQISAWKKLSGTAKDTGSGVNGVLLVATQTVGRKVYCYQADGTWRRITSEDDFNTYCFDVFASYNARKHTWKISVGGLRKGTLDVSVIAADWYDHFRIASAHTKLTKK